MMHGESQKKHEQYTKLHPLNPKKGTLDKSGLDLFRSWVVEPGSTATRTATLDCKQARQENTQAKPESMSVRSESILEKTATPSVMLANTSATSAKAAPGRLENIAETPD